MRNDYITRLVQICLDIANVADERGEVDKPYFEELGLGYRALSGILRRGCKEIIDLQNNYHGAIEAKNLAKIGEKEAHDVLEEMFGDREVYTINDNDKERIKAFVRSIQDECGKGEPMSDLISRQAAIEALERDMASLDHIIKGMSANDVRLDAYVSQRNQVNYDIYTINNLPPAQPERIKGHWTRDNACSECGCQPWFSGDIHNYNFCPNCGADMRGEQDE